MSDPSPIADGVILSSLTEIDIRHGFIRKVYGILVAQLVATFGIGAFVMHVGRPLMDKNPAGAMLLLISSLTVSIVIMCVFICAPGLMRQAPMNYILLGLFTVAESALIGFICLHTQASVLIALAITSLTVAALTLFACQTSWDFTGAGPYLLCACMVMLGLGFAMSIAAMVGLHSSPAFQTIRIFYAALGALLFSAYLVFDTQLIVGGKHLYRFAIDDHAMGAICLYIDIISALPLHVAGPWRVAMNRCCLFGSCGHLAAESAHRQVLLLA